MFDSRLLTIGARGSLIIPTVGIKYSHLGNKVFPPWEYLASYGQIRNNLRVIRNKGSLFKINLRVSANKLGVN